MLEEKSARTMFEHRASSVVWPLCICLEKVGAFSEK